MFEKKLKALARFQEKAPVFLLLIILIFTLFMGYYSIRLETDSSFDSMYSADSKTITLNNLVANEFGQTDSLFVLLEIDGETNEENAIRDIREPIALQALYQFGQSVREEDFVNGATSLADVLIQVHGRLPATLEESKEMIDAIPADISGLLSDNYEALNMFLSINVDSKIGSLDKIEAAIEARIEEAGKPAGTSLKYSGMPAVMNTIMNLLIGDNIKTVGFAVLAVFIILWIYFRSPVLAALTAAPVVLVLVWLSGLLYLLDIPISMSIAGVGAMMVGMGVDYAIHIAHSFKEKVEHGEKNVTEPVLIETGGALTVSMLTTAAGFLAMLAGSTPGSILQGTVLASGVVFAFIAALVVLPCLLIIQRRLAYAHLDRILFRLTSHKAQKEGKKEKKKPIVTKVFEKMAHFQSHRPMFVLAAAFLFTILIFPGLFLVRMDTDNANWVPDDDDTIETLDKIGAHFGGTDTMNLLITYTGYDDSSAGEIKDLRDPLVLKRMHELEQSIEEFDNLDGITSPIDDILQVNDGRIPNDLDRVIELIDQYPHIRDGFNDDYSIAMMTMRGDTIDEPVYFDVVEEIESIPMPSGVEVIVQGGAAEFVELTEMLSRDTATTTMLGFFLVILIASLFYRSIVVGMLAFGPIIIAIIWTIALMGLLDLPFTVLTTGTLAILMGMGVDFSIHIIHKQRVLLKEGKNIHQAIAGSLTSTGEAILVATITTIVGFLALTFATLLGTQRLGMTLALAIFCTFLSCLIIVPAILALEHRIKERRGTL